MGPGETVRLDHVTISRRDPHPDPAHWLEVENLAFMAYIHQYSQDYKVLFLADYFADFEETLRLSICSGNGLYVDGIEALGCDCQVDWLGDDCELRCLACVHGVCALAPTLPDGTASTMCDCETGWAGALCNVACPACDYDHSTCVADDAAGVAACVCQSGWGGAHCQHSCPPCDYTRATCGADTFHGESPGTAAKCGCIDPVLSTGLLCGLICPGPPEFCGQGNCIHRLEGRTYGEVTATELAQDASFCECNVGWVGLVCDDPCPGGPNHTSSPGPALCLGRGECAVGSAGVAQCRCVSGYIGEACDEPISGCGDGIVNIDAGEECDDGNNLMFDGCDGICRIEQNYLCMRTPRVDVTPVQGVALSLISVCSCPGVLSPVLGCLAVGL